MHASLDTVRMYVHSKYQGVYQTYFNGDTPAGHKLYTAKLHSPDGPKVFILAKSDGTLVDLTR